MTDKIIKKLPRSVAMLVHNFNRSLGKQNQGFYRWYEDKDDFNERGGITYHYVEYMGKDYRLSYMPKDGKLIFTGDAVEIAREPTGPEFDDGDD